MSMTYENDWKALIEELQTSGMNMKRSARREYYPTKNSNIISIHNNFYNVGRYLT